MLPDVIALKLPEAVEKLESVGIRIKEVVVTGPPTGVQPDGEVRVVRQKLMEDGACQLVVAYREYAGRRPCL